MFFFFFAPQNNPRKKKQKNLYVVHYSEPGPIFIIYLCRSVVTINYLIIIKSNKVNIVFIIYPGL